MPAEDMNRRKDRVVTEARKVVENINAMSFVNLDDHQVHSLMMMREIARGIVNNKLSKVTKSDVKKALSSSIEKMVGSCKDVNNILSRIPCEGMDDDQTHSVSRMKEIVSTIVSRRSKILGIRNRELLALEGVNAETAESKTGWAMMAINDDAEMGGIQRRLFENEAEQVMSLEYNQNEGIDIVMGEAVESGNGDLGEQALVVVDGDLSVCNEVQVAAVPPTEGLMFDDVELVVEVDERNEEKREPVNGTLERMSESGQNEVRKLALISPFRLTVVWPRDGKITLDWVKDMMAKLDQSSKKDAPSDFSSLMSSDVVEKLIGVASSVLSKEPNCVEVNCHREDSRVVIVGDVEGHFHDLLNIFALAGFPSDNQFYVFNGNYVDRGAWGLEVFLVLLAWKVLMPNRVYLLRGNHETRLCTTMFGFEQEVKTKFGDQGERVYQKCLECFKELPLASVISKSVYTTHGGLFRSIGYMRRSKRKRSQFLDLGSLEDLPKVKRSVVDVSDVGPSILADILWSDPSKDNGLVDNADKRLGLAWGPDCTEAFLRESKLKCIIRSHQGPDVRAGQDDFGDLLNGYSEDHVGESGKMFTLFSAPDYPQYGEPKYNNEGAYAVLEAPNFDTPSFHSFKAVRRPQLAAYSSSSTQISCPAWMRSKVDFEALGISNPPSFSVQFPDASGGIQAVEIPRASSVEGTPLPSDLQEPYKAAFEYLFELVAGLKHMISSRVIESGEAVDAVEGNVVNENEAEDTQNERGQEEESEDVPEVMEVDEKVPEEAVPNEYEEMSVPTDEISERNGPNDDKGGEIAPKEAETQEGEIAAKEPEIHEKEEEIAMKEPKIQTVVEDEKEPETQNVVDDDMEQENAPKEPETQEVEISPSETETQNVPEEEKKGEIGQSETETQNVPDDEKEGEIVLNDDKQEEEENTNGKTEAERIPDEKKKEAAPPNDGEEIPSKKKTDNIPIPGEEETVSKQTEEAELKSSDESKEQINAHSEKK